MRLTSSGNLLRITVICGIILFVLTGGVLTFFRLIERGSSKTARQEDSFYRILREYDISAGIFIGTEREFEKLNDELNRMEKKTIGVESWLSVLKRRRALANRYTPAAENYRNSIKRAQKAYPQSQPIAALAAAALVKNTALNKEAENSIRDILPMLTGSAFNSLRLYLHVILGDFKNPGMAVLIPPDIHSDGSEELTSNLALIKILRSDLRGAASELQTLLSSPYPSDSSIFLTADFLYDFGDLRRSAELFSRINTEEAMIRQADALYLAGFEGSARSLWSILSESAETNESSLYNMAVTSDKDEEAFYYLEKLNNSKPSPENTIQNINSRQFGLILYSRMLAYDEAIAALDGAKITTPIDYPYIDLEKCKRYPQRYAPARQIAEAWLLLDRHPEEEDLYRWAAWLMLFQRYYDEHKILLNRIEQFQFSRQWTDLYNAIQLMQEGNLETAEEILRRLDGESADWYVHANLGRILEIYRSTGRALDQYEFAASKIQNPKTAARIQYRIARCYSALGRPLEARQALEYAVDLDPENLTARLELER